MIDFAIDGGRHRVATALEFGRAFPGIRDIYRDSPPNRSVQASNGLEAQYHLALAQNSLFDRAGKFNGVIREFWSIEQGKRSPGKRERSRHLAPVQDLIRCQLAAGA